MKTIALACFAIVGTLAFLRASPTDHAIIAAMKLSERPNYAWTATIDDDAGSYVIEGKTDLQGYSWVRMPMPAALARRFGRESGGSMETVFRGKSAGLIRLDADWKTLAELPRDRHRADERPRPMVRGSASSGAFGIQGTQLAAAPFLVQDTSDARTYSTALFALVHPHEELGVIVSSFTSMHANGDVVSGTLSELGAALLFVRDDQKQAAPLAAAGEFKFWLSQGRVVKYQLRLEALVTAGRKNILTRLNSHTVLRDVGSTRVNVPDEAREKLSRVPQAGP